LVCSQALAATHRSEEAVAQIEQMLDMQIVCGEEDHWNKIVEGVQVCANELLPDHPQRYNRIKNAAVALFPKVAPRVEAIQKQSSACLLM
jgi:hypothetical protein